MYAYFKGVVIHKKAPVVTLEVQGIGYEILCPLPVHCRLDIGQETQLFIHFQVREDGHQLFGFLTEHSKEMFRELIKVNGVGPKVALAVLSTLTVEDLLLAVRDELVRALVAVPGIGQKTAQRLLIELKDRLKSGIWTQPSFREAIDEHFQVTSSDAFEDAVAALEALGYRAKDAQKTVQDVNQPGATSEDLIRSSLQKLAAAV